MKYYDVFSIITSLEYIFRNAIILNLCTYALIIRIYTKKILVNVVTIFSSEGSRIKFLIDVFLMKIHKEFKKLILFSKINFLK